MFTYMIGFLAAYGINKQDWAHWAIPKIVRNSYVEEVGSPG